MIVLLQQGKGADIGATFGGGGSTLFGASGADTFLTRTTTLIAICFMVTSVVLAIQVRGTAPSEGSIFKDAPKTEAVPAPPAAQKGEDESTSEAEGAAAGAEGAAESAEAGEQTTAPEAAPVETSSGGEAAPQADAAEPPAAAEAPPQPETEDKP